MIHLNHMDMDERTERIMKAAEYVRARLGGQKPSVGIVLGSGLGKLADRIEDAVAVPYREDAAGTPFISTPVTCAAPILTCPLLS